MKVLLYIILPPILAGLMAAAVYLPKYYLSPGLGPNAKNEQTSTEPPAKETTETVTYQGLILPYLSNLGSGDLESAESELEKLASQISPEMMAGLRVSLFSARQSADKMKQQEVEWLAKMQALAGEKNNALAELNRIETLQSDTEKKFLALKTEQDAEMAEIRVTMAALVKSNQLAKERFEMRQARLEETIASMKRGTVDSPEPPEQEDPPPAIESPVAEEPLKIPAPLSVHFEGDSIAIPDSVSMYVVQMGRWLKNDPRLGIRLQGRLQAGDISEAQKNLATARSNQVKGELIKNGATAEQIEVVALTDENSDSDGDTFGYVELIFSER